MRDDFSAEVKRTLAARAGHRCSVRDKATSGPGDTPELALSDGVAAHITAASPKGPRFDASLSSEARRSAENGIWVCTRHGREIDAATSAFSVEVLCGLKKIREERASRELQERKDPDDQTGLLVEFPYAATRYKLFEVLAPQAYTFPTTSALRDLLRSAEEPSRLLDLASEVIAETYESHPNVAGILSTLLSNNIAYWKPPPAVLQKLEHLCEAAIEASEWTRVASVEPLAFALAAQGCPDAHRKLLERLIVDTRWRDEDAARVSEYYGNVGIQIAAIFRHWKDPFREGLLRANDVARLIDLLLSSDKVLRPSVRQTLLDLLAEHAQLLYDSGARDLARSVNNFVEALRSMKGTTDRKLEWPPKLRQTVKTQNPLKGRIESWDCFVGSSPRSSS